MTASIAARPALTSHAGLTMPLLLTLSLFSALAPLATDLYLPLFPTMTGDLATSATGVQLTLTAFFVGLGLGQLIFGPLADRFGRRRPLIVGAAICLLASVGTAIAPSIAFLVVARFVQGLTGAAGMVIGRAVISDVTEGREAARAFNLMQMIGGLAPIVAPLVGSALGYVVGWRGLLWIVAACTAAQLLLAVTVVHESHPVERREHARLHHEAHGSPLRALWSRTYVGNTLAMAFGFAMMMGYIAASPFVFQSMLGLSTIHYGLTFGGIAVLLAASSAYSAQLTRTVPTQVLLRRGLTVGMAASLVVALVALTAMSLWIIAPLAVAVASLGFVLGNGSSLALASVPHSAGVGSAVLGFLQAIVGAGASALVSVSGEHSAGPLVTVMVFSAAVAITAGYAGTRRPETAAPLPSVGSATTHP